MAKPAGSLRILTIAALAALAAVPQGGLAQHVHGRVTDRVFRIGVSTASVFLLGPDGSQVSVALSDDQGWYHLRAPQPGPYGLLVERFGYRAHMHALFTLAAGDSLKVDLAMDADPFVMDPIRVEAQRRGLESGRAGFAWRCALGTGYCFDPDSIRRLGPRFPSDVIRLGVPEMLVSYTQGDTPVFRPVNYWPCVKIFRDHLVNPLSPAAFESIGLGDIVAVEVYMSFAKTPLDLRSGVRGPELWPEMPTTGRPVPPYPCGAILVWTKAAW